MPARTDRKAEITTLLLFNRWANDLLLNAATQLSAAAFTRDLQSSHRSVRGTLVHLMWGEWLWLQRWHGLSRTEVFSPGAFPAVEAIRSKWREVQEKQFQFLEQLSEEELEGTVTYRNLQGDPWTYPLRSMMQHVVNHSTYHRGQVVTLLRQSGIVPPPTDFLLFIDQQSKT